MYIESALLGITVALIVLAFAAFVAWGGHRYSYWERRAVTITLGLGAVLALICGIGVHILDTKQRQVTLFEIEIDAADARFWQFAFHVESPDIEHVLRIAPKPYFMRDADLPIVLEVSLRDGPEPPYVAELVFPVRTHYSGRDRLSEAKHHRWESQSLGFIPEKTGAHELKISLLEGHPQKLLIRIEDPTKRDGKRTDGY